MGLYNGNFRAIGHFFGYEGRCAFPSNFDANYCYNLGRVSALLINQDYNGYMARVYNLEKDVSLWEGGGIPITMLLSFKHNFDTVRDGRPVIKKALVSMDSKKYNYYWRKCYNENWSINDCYRFVSGIQFCGPKQITDIPPINVLLKKTNDIKWPIKAKAKDKEKDSNEKEKKSDT